MGFKTVLDGKALENLNLWCRIQFGHNFNQSGAFPVFSFLISLEGMVPYADQLLAPAEGLGQGFFLAKKRLIMLFGPMLVHFWCSVVT